MPIYVNEDAEAAYRNPMESAMNSIYPSGLSADGSYAGRAGTTGDWGEQSRIILGMDYDDWLRDKVVYGTPRRRHRAPHRVGRERWAWTS